ncbi:MAG: low molecular weight phosphatase family protein [Verrucomicrobiales bacterium]|nr:low molecular weight phosphatase family protein [Verrucomicrobiales bacterium]|tara:strand:+ start:22942 stop:23388 length:447 start_codon:yes stop_codon:yes gene_type:complete
MSDSDNVPLVLILCSGNSCRSQMAEALLQKAAGSSLRVASAGLAPSGYVHPLSIKAVAELGLDISDARSKSLDEFIDQRVETVITVCGNVDQICPVFPGQERRYHWPFDDPAHAESSEEEQMAVFRRVRDEIDQVFSAYGLGRKDGTS